MIFTKQMLERATPPIMHSHMSRILERIATKRPDLGPEDPFGASVIANSRDPKGSVSDLLRCLSLTTQDPEIPAVLARRVVVHFGPATSSVVVNLLKVFQDEGTAVAVRSRYEAVYALCLAVIPEEASFAVMDAWLWVLELILQTVAAPAVEVFTGDASAFIRVYEKISDRLLSLYSPRLSRHGAVDAYTWSLDTESGLESAVVVVEFQVPTHDGFATRLESIPLRMLLADDYVARVGDLRATQEVVEAARRAWVADEEAKRAARTERELYAQLHAKYGSTPTP